MTTAIDTIVPVVVIMGLGVAAQVLADRLAVPSVLFLVLAGVAVGPEGLGVVDPAAFGDALPAIVGLSVAIIVFEGAFHLHVDRLREAPSESIRLVTFGAAGSLVGTALAERLEDRGEEVVIVDNNSRVVEEARAAGYTVRHGDATDADTLRAAGAENAKVIAAATGDDDVNLLVAQLAKSRFGVETVSSRVNQPANVGAFEDLDIEAVPTGMSVAWSMDNFIERPGIAHWMTEMDRIGDVQEVELTSDAVAGKTVAEIGGELDDGCYIALISRDGESQVPHADDVLEFGDHVTFIGRKEAVRDAIDYCHPG